MLNGLRTIFTNALGYVPPSEQKNLINRWNKECERVQEIKEDIVHEAMRPAKELREENARLKKEAR